MTAARGVAKIPAIKLGDWAIFTHTLRFWLGLWVKNLNVNVKMWH